MNTRVVPLQRGPRWLAEGWQLFRVAPLGWLALVFAYWILMTFVSLLPVIGVALATVLVPPLSVGFMAAARAAAAGARPELAHLLEGFREQRRRQLVLGGIYTVLLALLIAATTLADDGTLARWLLTGQRPDEAALDSAGFVLALALAAGLYLGVTMLYWFAPVLVAWHGFGVGRALFYSYFALLLNWRAFLAYGAATALVTVVAPFFALSALLLLTGVGPRLIAPLLFSLLLVLMPVLFASFYASYRDIFGAEPPAPQA